MCNHDNPLDMAGKLDAAVDTTDDRAMRQWRRDHAVGHYSADRLYKRIREFFFSGLDRG